MHLVSLPPLEDLTFLLTLDESHKIAFRKYGSSPEEYRFTPEEFREKDGFPCSPLKNSIVFVSTPNGTLHKLTPEEFQWSSPRGRGAGGGGSVQRAKKVVSDSPGLVRLVNSVLNLPDVQVKYLEELN